METRRKNLNHLVGPKSQRGRIVKFAERYGIDATYVSQILNGHRNIGEKSARNLEDKIGLATGTLDAVWIGENNEIREPRPEYIKDQLRPDQIAILEGYEQSSDEAKKMILRLFGIDEDTQQPGHDKRYPQ